MSSEDRVQIALNKLEEKVRRFVEGYNKEQRICHKMLDLIEQCPNCSGKIKQVLE